MTWAIFLSLSCHIAVIFLLYTYHIFVIFMSYFSHNLVMILLYSCYSSAPLRTFACEQLAQWSQTELGSCMNPCLSPLSMLAGWKTFLGGCHSFLAFLMATPHLLFRISMLDDRSRPSNSSVLTAKALHHAGAAMSMRLMTGCGTLAGPNLELEDFLWPRRKWSVESPALRHPGALGRPGRPAQWRHKKYDMYILGIHLVYTCQTFMLNKKGVLMNDIMPVSPALVVICTCEFCFVMAVPSFPLLW